MFAMGYQSRSNEPNLTGFVQHLADGEQEIVYLLARALRRAGEPSGTLEADPKLRARALRYESTPDRVRYLRTLTEQIVVRCQAQLRRARRSRSESCLGGVDSAGSSTGAGRGGVCGLRGRKRRSRG